MTPTEERRFLTDVVETIAEATGGRPHGWMGPGLTETFETPAILKDLGLSCTSWTGARTISHFRSMCRE